MTAGSNGQKLAAEPPAARSRAGTISCRAYGWREHSVDRKQRGPKPPVSAPSAHHFRIVRDHFQIGSRGLVRLHGLVPNRVACRLGSARRPSKGWTRSGHRIAARLTSRVNARALQAVTAGGPFRHDAAGRTRNRRDQPPLSYGSLQAIKIRRTATIRHHERQLPCRSAVLDGERKTSAMQGRRFVQS